MKAWEKFRTYKQRGEWVELLFMAQAALHGFNVSKPMGDSAAWDVAIDRGPHFLRVQVKSTTDQIGAGYLCRFKPCQRNKRRYTLDLLDLFAAYVVPENVWYLIPAIVLLGVERKGSVMLCPVTAKWNDCKYERYREAWGLLGKSRSELARGRKSG